MGVGYQQFQAGSPDGYLDFGVISTPAVVLLLSKNAVANGMMMSFSVVCPL